MHHFSMQRWPPLCLVEHVELRSPAKMIASLPFLCAVCIHCSARDCTYCTGVVPTCPVEVSHWDSLDHKLPAPGFIYLSSGFSGQ